MMKRLEANYWSIGVMEYWYSLPIATQYSITPVLQNHDNGKHFLSKIDFVTHSKY